MLFLAKVGKSSLGVLAKLGCALLAKQQECYMCQLCHSGWLAQLSHIHHIFEFSFAVVTYIKKSNPTLANLQTFICKVNV